MVMSHKDAVHCTTMTPGVQTAALEAIASYMADGTPNMKRNSTLSFKVEIFAVLV